MDFFLIFLGTIASCMAAFFSYLSFKLGHLMAERARPCVGESSWVRYGDKLFGTLRIFPGQYFVQTKSIKVPGHKVSSVTTYQEGVKKYPLSRGEELDELSYSVSVPVNRDVVEMRVCVTPAPEKDFEVQIHLARKEDPIIYRISYTDRLSGRRESHEAN